MDDQPENAERLVEPDPEFWEGMMGVDPADPAARAKAAVEETLHQAADQGKGSFLNINVSRNKGIQNQLQYVGDQVARLATAVERLLEEAYGVRSQEGDMRGEEPEVGYTNQDEYDIEEALQQAKNLEETGDEAP